MRTNNRRRLLTALLLILATVPAGAKSLWLSGKDLYSAADAREFRSGDIITIVLTEETSAQQAATTNTQDDSQVEVKATPSIPFFKKVVDRLIGKNEIKNNWKGNGSTSRSGRLTGTVTAVVLEVLPNGNLLVEGKRSLKLNRETQHLKVRGIARPQDIDAKNSISSKLLAEAEIKYDGRGAVGSTQRPGLMTKIVNFVF